MPACSHITLSLQSPWAYAIRGTLRALGWKLASHPGMHGPNSDWHHSTRGLMPPQPKCSQPELSPDRTLFVPLGKWKCSSPMHVASPIGQIMISSMHLRLGKVKRTTILTQIVLLCPWRSAQSMEIPNTELPDRACCSDPGKYPGKMSHGVRPTSQNSH